MSDRKEVIRRLTDHLESATHLRVSATTPEASAARRALRAWQAERLARTHADLLASPRFGRAASFFLADIYGLEDLSRRDAAIKRIVPIMNKLLPLAGLETVADAVELDALTESLDAQMIQVLASDVASLSAKVYARAYRQVGRRRDRERQIALVDDLGHALDRLTRQPLIGTTLAMMRKPARLMGLGDLQDLLEEGYAALEGMGDVDQFLRTIMDREQKLMKALFAGDDSLLA